MPGFSNCKVSSTTRNTSGTLTEKSLPHEISGPLARMSRVTKVLNQHTVVKSATVLNDNDKPDFFYQVLSERVAEALRQVGIDPIQDRGATVSRTLYYWIVFVAWIGMGYWHVKVGRKNACC